MPARLPRPLSVGRWPPLGGSGNGHGVEGACCLSTVGTCMCLCPTRPSYSWGHWQWEAELWVALEAPLEGPGGAEDRPESFLEEGVQGPSPADRNRRRGRPRGESLGGGVQVVPRALRPHQVSLRGGTGAGAGGSRCRAAGGGGGGAGGAHREGASGTHRANGVRTRRLLPSRGGSPGVPLCLLQESRTRSNAEPTPRPAGLVTAAESHHGQ